MTANILGAGPVVDALVIAIKLPSLLRRILAEGAFNAAFVPIYASMIEEHGKEKAVTFAEQILSILVITLIAIVLIVEVLMPWLIPLFVPGFNATPERLELAITFTRITFPFIIFISLTALYSGMLNSVEKFAAAASSPMAGNMFIIAFVLSVSSFIDDTGVVFAAAITGCGIIQLLWVLVPAHRSGMGLRLIAPKMTRKVKELLRLMGPAALGSGVHQVNVYIGIIISSLLPVGGISYLYYAERLNQLPLSVIGTAMGTVLLPILSKKIRKGDKQAAKETQNQGIEFALLLTVPAMIGLVTLAHPIIMVLFQHGAFDADAAHKTSFALMAYSIGLPAYVLTKIFNASFYAQKDTRTPLKTALVSVVVDIVLCLAFLSSLQHVGIALATALAAWINVLLLGRLLWKKGFLAYEGHLRFFTPRLLLASAGTVLSLETGKYFLESQFQAAFANQVMALATLVLGGLTVFILSAQATGALNFKYLRLQFSEESS